MTERVTPTTPPAEIPSKAGQRAQTPVTDAPVASTPDSAKSCIVVALFPPSPPPVAAASRSSPSTVDVPIDVQAEIRFLESFPNGHRRIATSAEGNLCGLHALVASVTAQVSCSPPTLPELRDIARSDAMLALELAIFDVPRSLEDSYHVDQLAAILRFWGEARGLDLQLGYLLQSGRCMLVPGPTTPNTQVVWISSTSEDGAEAAYLDHYEGLRPLDARRPSRHRASSTRSEPREIPDSDDIDQDSTTDEDESAMVTESRVDFTRESPDAGDELVAEDVGLVMDEECDDSSYMGSMIEDSNLDDEDSDLDVEDDDSDVAGDDAEESDLDECSEDDVADKPDGTTRRGGYTIKLSDMPKSYKDHIDSLNKRYPVDDGDSDVEAFDTKFKALVEKVTAWAKSGSKEERKEWYARDPVDREMTMSYRDFLIRHSDGLAQAILNGMPRKSRQVLGRAKKICDLLDLPEGAESTVHQLTYFCVLTKFSPRHITRGPHPHFHYAPRKTDFLGAKQCNLDAKKARESWVYVGSSITGQGGRHRIRQHTFLGNLTAAQRALYGVPAQARLYTKIRATAPGQSIRWLVRVCGRCSTRATTAIAATPIGTFR